MFRARRLRYDCRMNPAFDPATFITSVMISYAQKHPVAHGVYVMFCFVVSILPRVLFDHPKFGWIFHLLGRLSVLVPRGAIGTLKMPGQLVRWPEVPPPPPVPPTLRVARPNVVRPPSSGASDDPHPTAAADDPTPVDGVARGSIVPAPIEADGDEDDDDSAVRATQVPSSPRGGADDPNA